MQGVGILVVVLALMLAQHVEAEAPQCLSSDSVVSRFCRDGVCMPRLFILGAAKSSTTSLWSLMRWKFDNMCSPVALDGDPKWFR